MTKLELWKSENMQTFILLDANPLDDINNTRKISGVFVNGRWIDREKIDTMLSDLAKRNSANKEKYDWKKRKEF